MAASPKAAVVVAADDAADGPVKPTPPAAAATKLSSNGGGSFSKCEAGSWPLGPSPPPPPPLQPLALHLGCPIGLLSLAASAAHWSAWRQCEHWHLLLHWPVAVAVAAAGCFATLSAVAAAVAVVVATPPPSSAAPSPMSTHKHQEATDQRTLPAAASLSILLSAGRPTSKHQGTPPSSIVHSRVALGPGLDLLARSSPSTSASRGSTTSGRPHLPPCPNSPKRKRLLAASPPVGWGSAAPYGDLHAPGCLQCFGPSPQLARCLPSRT